MLFWVVQESDLKQGGGSVTSENLYPDVSTVLTDPKGDPDPLQNER